MTVSTLSAFRVATADDAPEIGDFQIRAWRQNYTEFLPSWVVDGFSVEERVAAWRQILRRPAFHDNTFAVLCADEQGIAALGAASGQRSPKLKAMGYTAEINALYVRDDLQHHGLGHRLLGRLFGDLGARGHRSATHWVMRQNRKGAEFLEATGATVLSLASTRADEESDLAFGWRDIGRPDSLAWRDPRSHLSRPETLAAMGGSMTMGRDADHDAARRYRMH